MRFYWNYEPCYWEGLRKHGLLEGDIGVRLAHSPYAAEDQLTNEMLRKGGPLWDLILKNAYGLLIDRGCGGIEYRAYDFDKVLLDEMASHLGDKFLGVQMHEWYSNMVNDYGRIATAGSVDQLADQIASGSQDLLENHFEYGDASDYRGRSFPKTVGEFLQEADFHFRRKAADFHHYVNLTDSYYQSFWKGFQNGARHAMAEVGGQTALTRMQIASARGAARAFERPWGVYYEPWACPLSVLWYNRSYSAWKMPPGIWDAPYFVHGGRGGSSRALQRRILYYSLLAGAGSMAEEWGAENTFLDWETFELTDYGKIMSEFFRFSHQTDVGRPLTEVALMLDPENAPPDTNFFDDRFPTVMRFYEPSEIDKNIKRRMRQLFGAAIDNEGYGEPHTLTASEFPDVFDVVYSDISAEKLAKYSMVYYLGENFPRVLEKFSAQHGNLIEGTIDASVQVLKNHLTSRLPVWVDGPIAWTINETAEGWVLGLFNNEGVNRSVDADESYDLSASCEASVDLKGLKLGDSLGIGRSEVRPTDIVSRDGLTKIHVPAGDCRLFRVHLGD